MIWLAHLRTRTCAEHTTNIQRVLEMLRRADDLLREVLAQRDGHAAFGALLRYILATHEHLDRKKLERVLVETIDVQAGEEVVTVYEQLIEEGRKKGRTEGRTAMLLDMLAVKFGPVPADVQDRVAKAGADELIAWGRRVLTAATLEEALAPTAAPRPARRASRPRR